MANAVTGRFATVTLTSDQIELIVKCMERRIDTLRATIITCPIPDSKNVRAALESYSAEILTLESAAMIMLNELRYVK